MTLRTAPNHAAAPMRLMHAGSVTMSAVKDRLGTSSGGAATQAATPVVYLIERDPRTLEHLSGQLTGRGYLVHCFDSIEEYSRFPRCALPSCLIVDADAADAEMSRLQQGLQDGSQVPVIFTSANPEISRVVRSIRAGATDFLRSGTTMHREFRRFCVYPFG